MKKIYSLLITLIFCLHVLYFLTIQFILIDEPIISPFLINFEVLLAESRNCKTTTNSVNQWRVQITVSLKNVRKKKFFLNQQNVKLSKFYLDKN